MALGSSEATHCTGANGHILCPVLLGMVEMPSVSLPTWESSQVVTHSTDVGLQKKQCAGKLRSGTAASAVHNGCSQHGQGELAVSSRES